MLRSPLAFRKELSGLRFLFFVLTLGGVAWSSELRFHKQAVLHNGCGECEGWSSGLGCAAVSPEVRLRQ